MKYGTELVLDMCGCDVAKFNRREIKSYFEKLCVLIGMKAEDLYFWDDYHVPKEKRQTNPRTKGTTAIQFILTSNITIHTLDLLGVVFINIFSCEDYDIELAKAFTVGFFGAQECKAIIVERGIF